MWSSSARRSISATAPSRSSIVCCWSAYPRPCCWRRLPGCGGAGWRWRRSTGCASAPMWSASRIRRSVCPSQAADDELRRLAQTLNRMLDRLQDGYARERAFVDDAAHELRTPLTMLRGELELAGTRPRSPAELEATVQSARRQTERLVALANDLLILARSADGQLPIRRERLDGQTMLEAAALRAGARAEGRAIAVTPAQGAFDADRLRIEQALDNLIANALEHGDGRVVIGATNEPDALLLTVDDDGSELDPAVAQNAFDRFTRGDKARAGSGTGLGLAIVKAIAAAHGGTV